MINIFNFKKYFRRAGDNAVAKIGHVNSVLPLVITDTPSNLGLVPEFIGQIAIDSTDTGKVWIAYNATQWNYFVLD